MVRNILLETRGSLPIYVVLKEWTKVAAAHGVSTTVAIRGPNGKDSQQAMLLVNNQTHSAKVFDNLTEEVQEWVLKHWKSKDYFQSMIEGVKIGLIKSYKSPRTFGQKWGAATTWDRRKNQDTHQFTPSFYGYLTAKDTYATNDGFYTDWAAGKEDRAKWEYRMLGDLERKSDEYMGSVLVHEFQHWFQAGVLFMASDSMRPVDGNGNPKDRRNPNLLPPSDIALRTLKMTLPCIDWNDTLVMNGITGYKVTDQQQLVDLIGSYDRHTVDIVRMVTLTMDEQAAKDFLMKDLARQAMRIGNKLTDAKIDEAWGRLMYSNNGGHEYRPKKAWAFIHSVEITLIERNFNWNAINPLRIYVMPETDFVKKNQVYTDEPKEGRKPIPAKSDKSFKRTRYIWFARGTQRMPYKNRNRNEHDFKRERNPGEEFSAAWNESWAEFDAELANYMQWQVREWMKDVHSTCQLIMKSDTEAYTDELVKQIKIKMRRRQMSAIANLPQNEEQIRTIAERIADRLVETAENFDYDYFLDNVVTPTEKARLPTPAQFHEWVNLNYNSRQSRFEPYFKWLSRKAAGENV